MCTVAIYQASLLLNPPSDAAPESTDAPSAELDGGMPYDGAATSQLSSL